MSRLAELFPSALVGAAATTVATAALEARPPGGRRRWERTNYAGRSVTLLGGAAVGAGAVGASAAMAGLSKGPAARTAAAAAVAAAAGAAMGLVDDLGEDTAAERTKGLRGHLGALAQGRVTTGALKIAGIGAGALVAAAVATPRRSGPVAHVAEILAGAALVAGTANLHNLFDLRPGRALKVAALLSGPLALAAPPAPSAVAATALGVATAALPDDLGEVTMLGDTGANAVGAMVGVALAAHPSRTLRASALTGVVALTLLSEKVSFSRIIETTGVLARLDALGRRSG